MKCPKHKGSAEVRGSRGSFSLGFCAPQLRATSKTLRSAICFCTPGGRPWLRCPRTPAYNGSPQARCPQTLARSGGPRAGAHGPPRIVEVRKHGARALPRYAHRPPRTAEVRGYSAHEPPHMVKVRGYGAHKPPQKAEVRGRGAHELPHVVEVRGYGAPKRFSPIPPLGRPLVRVSVLVIVMPHSALKHQEKSFRIERERCQSLRFFGFFRKGFSLKSIRETIGQSYP